ncbi:YlqD family protein [Desulfuribacillus alkaliarsenatis]|uniref:YlqD protein n=1 Tax=Desulfuribacillus alkaliarsenatis TaxID=766136 RepID=A0A1E5G5W8_9FIRM|nr:YlqD family protein [Desulfuribacillus alkaliarsenatis]OEF98571.1 hypothetical protein BHF68_02590 [Desulfuribacillus alkaliarsenatis]
MLIKRPVKVKMVMTPQLRKQLEAEYLGELQQIRLELEQLEFQNKKLVLEAKRKKLDAEQVNLKFKKEKQTRLSRLERLEIRIKEYLKLPDDVEIIHSTVDSYVNVKVGDKWDTLVEGVEIVLKDGIVVEIRN